VGLIVNEFLTLNYGIDIKKTDMQFIQMDSLKILPIIIIYNIINSLNIFLVITIFQAQRKVENVDLNI